jgi:hypothetical protein
MGLKKLHWNKDRYMNMNVKEVVIVALSEGNI